MSFYTKFKADKDLESGAGVAIDYGDSGKIVIHRAGGSNRRYARVLESKMKKYRFQIQQGTMDEEVAERLMAEVYAEAVILRLIDVPGPDGEMLESTKDNIVKLLLDVPDLFADIKQQAGSAALFRQQETEEAVKNSKRSSAGA